MMIYPVKGQSAEQQQKDEFECYQWAVQQTGFDPTKAQQTPQQQTTQRGVVRFAEQPVERFLGRESEP